MILQRVQYLPYENHLLMLHHYDLITQTLEYSNRIQFLWIGLVFLRFENLDQDLNLFLESHKVIPLMQKWTEQHFEAKRVKEYLEHLDKQFNINQSQKLESH